MCGEHHCTPTAAFPAKAAQITTEWRDEGDTTAGVSTRAGQRGWCLRPAGPTPEVGMVDTQRPLKALPHL